MNTPLMSASYDSSSDFSSLGTFSLTDSGDFEGITRSALPGFGSETSSETQFHIIIKRADPLYRTLNILNTIFSIFAVLLIVSTFIMVFYSLVTITEVADMVSQVKEHNTLTTASP